LILVLRFSFNGCAILITGLTLLLSGEALHAATLLDRRSKDNAKEKVKTFMKEIASAYKLTASTPEINDNGMYNESRTMTTWGKIFNN